MDVNGPDTQNHIFLSNSMLKKKINSQDESPNTLNFFDTKLFDLNNKVEKKIYNLYIAGDYIDEQENNLRQEIIKFKTNYELQLLNIQSKVQMTLKMGTIYDKKLLELIEVKKLNQLKLKKWKDRILELQEIEIANNEYSIQLEQTRIKDLKQETMNDEIEQVKETIHQLNVEIKEIDENVEKAKEKACKINKKIDRLQENKQNMENIINNLSQKIEMQTLNSSKQNQDIDAPDFSKYNNKIVQLRKLQLSYMAKISNLVSKDFLIDSQLTNVSNKIQLYRSTPSYISTNTECENKFNEAYIKRIQNNLKRTELINGNVKNLFNSLPNEIISIRKEKEVLLSKLGIIKNELSVYNQNEMNLANLLNQIENKIKNTVKSTEKMTKLMEYYDECAVVSPISFSFSKKTFDKIRNSAYKLAQADVNHETELINQIKICKNQCKKLIFKISKQRLKNQNLRKKIEEMHKNT